MRPTVASETSTWPISRWRTASEAAVRARSVRLELLASEPSSSPRIWLRVWIERDPSLIALTPITLTMISSMVIRLSRAISPAFTVIFLA